MTFICLTCNYEAPSLYKTTAGTFIKLMNCERCNEIVDNYVECERSIVLTDLIMQETAAYKHVLYNSSDFTYQFYMKLALCIILSEGYVRWLSLQGFANENQSIRKHEIIFYKMCAYIVSEMILFSLVTLLLCYPPNKQRSVGKFLKAVVLGQSGRLLNIPAIIYKQSSSLPFQLLIYIFIFVSSTQSLRVISGRGRIATSVTVAFAYAFSIGATRILAAVFYM